jgi:hypothetical protein
MANDPATPGNTSAVLCTAPEHVVDLILGLMPAAAPDNVAQVRARRATAAAYANRIWAEAAHAGAAWGLARAPLKIEVDVGKAPLLGDLIRDTDRR